MLIVEFNPEDKAKVKKYFKQRGSIKICAKKIKHDRTTVGRIVEKGRGNEKIVNKIVAFVNNQPAA